MQRHKELLCRLVLSLAIAILVIGVFLCLIIDANDKCRKANPNNQDDYRFCLGI